MKTKNNSKIKDNGIKQYWSAVHEKFAEEKRVEGERLQKERVKEQYKKAAGRAAKVIQLSQLSNRESSRSYGQTLLGKLSYAAYAAW